MIPKAGQAEGHQHHKAHSPRPESIRVYVVTISDSRDEATDTSGRLAKDLVTAAGCAIAGYRVVKDEPAEVSSLLREIAEQRAADVVITSGGTGISRRDSTYEAVSALLEKTLDGFGELFRMLSYQEIGSAAMMSRAVGGLFRGVVIFALPGSSGAVRLGLEKLILAELPHLVFEKSR